MSNLIAPTGAGLALPSQYNRPINHPVTAYLNSLTSPRSVETMRKSLSVVAGLVTGGFNDNGLPHGDPWSVGWERVTPDVAVAIRSAMANATSAKGEVRWSAATRNRMLCALRGVLEHAEMLDLIDAKQLRRCRRALKGFKVSDRGRIRTGRAMNNEELAAIKAALMSAEHDRTPWDADRRSRDRALLSIAILAGLRRSEIVSLDRSDWCPHPEAPDVPSVRVRHGKGDKERVVPAGPIVEQVAPWLAVRGEEEGPLFWAIDRHHGIRQERISAQTVYDICKRWSKRADIPRIRPHDGRRSFITQLARNGVDIEIRRRLAGHESVVTTSRYDHRGLEEEVAAMNTLHGLL